MAQPQETKPTQNQPKQPHEPQCELGIRHRLPSKASLSIICLSNRAEIKATRAMKADARPFPVQSNLARTNSTRKASVACTAIIAFPAAF